MHCFSPHICILNFLSNISDELFMYLSIFLADILKKDLSLIMHRNRNKVLSYSKNKIYSCVRFLNIYWDWQVNQAFRHDSCLVSWNFKFNMATGHMGQFTKMRLEESGISKGNNQLTFHYTENVHNMIYGKKWSSKYHCHWKIKWVSKTISDNHWDM